MATSANGWPVYLETDDKHGGVGLRRWVIPGANRALMLRDGSAGLVLVHIALWWHETIARLDQPGRAWDEWGWAVRPIRGKSSGYSNHASGTACDLDATKHPRGVAIARTFTPWQIVKIRARLAFYRGCAGWGGNYIKSWNVDGMHFELLKALVSVERLARFLATTPRGKRILDANPGSRQVVFS